MSIIQILHKLSIASLFFISSCTNVAHEETRQEPVIPPASQLSDTTDGTPYIAIISDRKDGKNFKLSKTDIILIDSLLNAAAKEYNIEQTKRIEHASKKLVDSDRKRLLIDLRYYKRQYLPYINEKGERAVWIYCFCTYWKEDRKTKVICVDDGGKCFFQLTINLDNRTIGILSTNGYA